MSATSHTNRLINESSPYLLQHAHNPVEWYPWGKEALERARAEDKPILLSIGYSACHWCHVMERECFEDEAIASLMNEHFVCIKVDREELPDVDQVYMEAVQAMTGGGGWPLTVFLTPELEPFYGGTYFPPHDRLGLPGFPRILKAVSEAYLTNRSDVAATARQVTTYLRQKNQVTKGPATLLSPEILTEAYSNISKTFDHKNGGFGSAPKFPQPLLQEFLLTNYERTRDEKVLGMIQHTLARMAAGGIFDHIGGGFHRYSVDAQWLVPHFEKMLYDNALLSRLYLYGYQVTQKPLYRRVAEDILSFVLTEMTSSQGAFYSAQDADTEGIEGKYYVWTPDEITGILGMEVGGLIIRYYGISDHGNFEGRNVLTTRLPVEEFAAAQGIGVNEAADIIDNARDRLLAFRRNRPRPNLDTKVLTSWNALMLRSFSEAALILNNESYKRAASANADFLLSELRSSNCLMHSWAQGRLGVPGYLDDHAFLIRGLLALHEATFEQRWLEEALLLVDEMILRFASAEHPGVLFDTSKEHSNPLIRPRETSDSVMPSGNSAAADVLLRAAVITGESKYHDLGKSMLQSVRRQMTEYPLSSAHWLLSLNFLLFGPTEITIIGDPAETGTQHLVNTISQTYVPNKVLLGLKPDDHPTSSAASAFANRTALDGQPTVHLCHGHTCHPPVTDPLALENQLVPPKS